jgi:hypothetical protein
MSGFPFTPLFCSFFIVSFLDFFLNKFLVTENTDVKNVTEKQDATCDEHLLNFDFKALCFAGLYPYEKICNTLRKLKLYRAYQITLYVLYCPILFSQIEKLHLPSADLQVAIETITHIVIGFSPCSITHFTNWNEVYKLICKIDMSMQNKRSTQNYRNTRET